MPCGNISRTSCRRNPKNKRRPERLCNVSDVLIPAAAKCNPNGRWGKRTTAQSCYSKDQISIVAVRTKWAVSPKVWQVDCSFKATFGRFRWYLWRSRHTQLLMPCAANRGSVVNSFQRQRNCRLKGTISRHCHQLLPPFSRACIS